jgi:hypothetical protein
MLFMKLGYRASTGLVATKAAVVAAANGAALKEVSALEI